MNLCTTSGAPISGRVLLRHICLLEKVQQFRHTGHSEKLCAS
jgi:hypothetical protein